MQITYEIEKKRDKDDFEDLFSASGCVGGTGHHERYEEHREGD